MLNRKESHESGAPSVGGGEVVRATPSSQRFRGAADVWGDDNDAEGLEA